MMVMMSVLESALTVSPTVMSTETTVPLIGLVKRGLVERLLGVGQVGLGGVDGGLVGGDLLGRVGVGPTSPPPVAPEPVAPEPVLPEPAAPEPVTRRSRCRCCRVVASAGIDGPWPSPESGPVPERPGSST